MSQNVKFEHGGDVYEMSPLSEFQELIIGHILSDIGAALFGSWDDTPSMQKQLIVFFARWRMASRINGEPFNVLTDTTKECYQEFAQRIATDNELAAKWMRAYKQVNLETDDPNAVSGEPEAGNG